MKSLGARIAAGAVIVLLGGFAAMQAQKDRQESDQSWEATKPDSADTPAPLPGVGDSQADAPKSSNALQHAQNSLKKANGDSDSAIQLVQFTVPDESETKSIPNAPSRIELPTLSNGELPGTLAPAVEASETDAPSLSPDWLNDTSRNSPMCPRHRRQINWRSRRSPVMPPFQVGPNRIWHYRISPFLR